MPMIINLPVFRVADLSHLHDAEQDRGRSAVVDSPPHASWRVMKDPALPSARSMELVCACALMRTTSCCEGRWGGYVGMRVGNPRNPFIPNR